MDRNGAKVAREYQIIRKLATKYGVGSLPEVELKHLAMTGQDWYVGLSKNVVQRTRFLCERLGV